MTESDFWTFVIPNTAFGVFGILAGPALTTRDAVGSTAVWSQLPRVLVWNWLNLTVFDLANQRLSESAAEDALNKPWRAIPAGLLTPTQMRRVLLATLPVVLAVNYALGAWHETALLFVLTWMYNDLRGGDEDFVLRNLIIGFAFALYNGGSLRIACGDECSVTMAGHRWTALISAVIFSTMHIQDLKDVAGDKARNRRSAPLILGEGIARWTIAVPVLAWSVLCPLYLGVGLLNYVMPVLLGVGVAFCTLSSQSHEADRRSWQYWAVWLMCLYLLPLSKNHGMLSRLSI